MIKTHEDLVVSQDKSGSGKVVVGAGIGVVHSCMDCKKLSISVWKASTAYDNSAIMNNVDLCSCMNESVISINHTFLPYLLQRAFATAANLYWLHRKMESYNKASYLRMCEGMSGRFENTKALRSAIGIPEMLPGNLHIDERKALISEIELKKGKHLSRSYLAEQSFKEGFIEGAASIKRIQSVNKLSQDIDQVEEAKKEEDQQLTTTIMQDSQTACNDRVIVLPSGNLSLKHLVDITDKAKRRKNIMDMINNKTCKALDVVALINFDDNRFTRYKNNREQ